MRFLPELKDFLKANGKIYTVRKYKYSDGLVLVMGVGKCRRTLVQKGITKKCLVDYYPNSGFPTVEDWWAKIVRFIPNEWDTKYLYMVEVVDGTRQGATGNS
jgi:hypothetical protein